MTERSTRIYKIINEEKYLALTNLKSTEPITIIIIYNFVTAHKTNDYFR